MGGLRHLYRCPLRLKWPSDWCRRARRKRAHSREAPERWRYNSDDWSQGTASMASAQTIQASCQARRSAKIVIISNDCRFDDAARKDRGPHPKFAIRSILVRRTRIEQTQKQRFQASSVAFAIIGFGAAPSPG